MAVMMAMYCLRMAERVETLMSVQQAHMDASKVV